MIPFLVATIRVGFTLASIGRTAQDNFLPFAYSPLAGAKSETIQVGGRSKTVAVVEDTGMGMPGWLRDNKKAGMQVIGQDPSTPTPPDPNIALGR